MDDKPKQPSSRVKDMAKMFEKADLKTTGNPNTRVAPASQMQKSVTPTITKPITPDKAAQPVVSAATMPKPNRLSTDTMSSLSKQLYRNPTGAQNIADRVTAEDLQQTNKSLLDITYILEMHNNEMSNKPTFDNIEKELQQNNSQGKPKTVYYAMEYIFGRDSTDNINSEGICEMSIERLKEEIEMCMEEIVEESNNLKKALTSSTVDANNVIDLSIRLNILTVLLNKLNNVHQLKLQYGDRFIVQLLQPGIAYQNNLYQNKKTSASLRDIEMNIELAKTMQMPNADAIFVQLGAEHERIAAANEIYAQAIKKPIKSSIINSSKPNQPDSFEEIRLRRTEMNKETWQLVESILQHENVASAKIINVKKLFYDILKADRDNRAKIDSATGAHGTQRFTKKISDSDIDKVIETTKGNLPKQNFDALSSAYQRLQKEEPLRKWAESYLDGKIRSGSFASMNNTPLVDAKRKSEKAEIQVNRGQATAQLPY